MGLNERHLPDHPGNNLCSFSVSETESKRAKMLIKLTAVVRSERG